MSVVNVRFTEAQRVIGRMVRSDEWLGSWFVFNGIRNLDAPESLRGKLIGVCESKLREVMCGLDLEVSDISDDTIELILIVVDHLYGKPSWVSRCLLWVIGKHVIVSWLVDKQIQASVIANKAANQEIYRAFLLGVLWRIVSPK